MKRNSPKAIATVKSKKKSAGQSVRPPGTASLPAWVFPLLLAITALIFSRAATNGFAWDDDLYVLNNEHIKEFSWTAIRDIFTSFYFGNYHPLTTLTYLFEYALYGQNPLPYHVFNIVLHVINVWLVYLFARNLSRNSLVGLISAFIFAVHPMRVESVAWISERKDVLYGLFFILSMITYGRYLDQNKKRRNYILSFVFFIAALMSKSAAVTLPLLLVLFDIYKSRKPNSTMILEKIPFFILSAIFGILALFSQQAQPEEAMMSYGFVNRIFLFTYAFAFYIMKLIAPFHLSAAYYYPELENGFLPVVYYLSLPVILLVLIPIAIKSKWKKEILFAVLFYVLSILPVLQIMPFGAMITADRYSYIPYTGFFILAARMLVHLFSNGRTLMAVVIIAVFGGMFIILTWQRIGVWKNGETLFTDVIEKRPDYYHGYWVRAEFRKNKGNSTGAFNDLKKTIALNPRFAYAHNAIGTYYKNAGISDSAIYYYSQAISHDSSLAEAYNNRGIMYSGIHRLPAANDDFTRAIELSPHDASYYSNRGNAKAMMKDFGGALQDFNRSLQLNPDAGNVYFNRGSTKYQMNDSSGACSDWGAAAKLGDPNAPQKIEKYCR